MPTQNRALTVMPRRTVARYVDEDDFCVPVVRQTDDLREIKKRLAQLERTQATTSNLPVVATVRHEEAPVVVQQPREGFLRGIMRRMAD
jgi:hypothetical protein